MPLQNYEVCVTPQAVFEMARILSIRPRVFLTDYCDLRQPYLDQSPIKLKQEALKAFGESMQDFYEQNKIPFEIKDLLKQCREKSIKENSRFIFSRLNTLAIKIMYGDYDTTKDFQPQFENNIRKAKTELHRYLNNETMVFTMYHGKLYINAR